jgi:beta-glucosidase
MKRRHLLLGAATSAIARPSAAQSSPDQALFDSFGKDFTWGASTSSYQIEGATGIDGRGPSIWDTFVRTPGNIRTGESGDVVTDHYHRYPEDVALIERAGFNAYRFSIAWPRVMPAGSGPANPRGLDFYDRLVDLLLKQGIQPWACLYHWDLPQALQDKGGWLDRETANRFVDYAEVVARRLADRVGNWVMFNEANVHALLGHGLGNHAPGLVGRRSYAGAMHHQNLAQGLALQSLRAQQGNRVRLGTVACIEPAVPVSESEADRRAAAFFGKLWNGAVLDPLFKGTYPEGLDDLFGEWIKPGDMATTRQPLDFFGLNYYSLLHIQHDGANPFGAAFGPAPAGVEFTGMGWPVEPDGLYRQLIDLKASYGNPVIHISENGAAYDDTFGSDGAVNDAARIAFIRGHLAAAQRARAEGVNLQGYFVWSLLDNFEWAEGTAKRFGIVHVDFATLKRTPKTSWHWFARHLRR